MAYKLRVITMLQKEKNNVDASQNDVRMAHGQSAKCIEMRKARYKS